MAGAFEVLSSLWLDEEKVRLSCEASSTSSNAAPISCLLPIESYDGLSHGRNMPDADQIPEWRSFSAAGCNRSVQRVV